MRAGVGVHTVVKSQLCKGHVNTSRVCFPLQLRDQEEAVGEPAAAAVAASLAVAEGQAVVRYEYHVLYSCSYRIPVLYFRASTLGMCPQASRQDVLSQISHC